MAVAESGWEWVGARFCITHNFAARLKQANLTSKNNIVYVVKKQILMTN